MSMWLSGANAVIGKTRGRASAQAKRQASSLWSAALAPGKPKKRRSKR